MLRGAHGSFIAVPRFTPGALLRGSFDCCLGHPTVEHSAGFRRDGRALRRRMLPEVQMETRLSCIQRLELTKDIKVGGEEAVKGLTLT